MLRKIIFHTPKNKSACNPVCVQSWPIYKISAPLNTQMHIEILSISQNFITHLRILRMDKYTLKLKHETVVRRKSGTVTCSTRDSYMFILSRTPVQHRITSKTGAAVVWWIRCKIASLWIAGSISHFSGLSDKTLNRGPVSVRPVLL